MLAIGEDAIATARERLDHARSRLRLLSPAAQIEQGHLRLDDLSNRLGSALRSGLQGKRQRLSEARGELARRTPETRIQLESHRLLGLWKRLQAASPASVLNRGFIIIRDEHGRPVSRKAAIAPGDTLEAEFSDGRQRLKAE